MPLASRRRRSRSRTATVVAAAAAAAAIPLLLLLQLASVPSASRPCARLVATDAAAAATTAQERANKRTRGRAGREGERAAAALLPLLVRAEQPSLTDTLTHVHRHQQQHACSITQTHQTHGDSLPSLLPFSRSARPPASASHSYYGRCAAAE